MIEYAKLKKDRRKFLALTGLTNKEFKALLPHFTKSYERAYPRDKTQRGQPRQRDAGGGRRGVLGAIEQKLLFILVYQKAYPLQVVMGELFGMNQSAANQWIHRLLPIIHTALLEMGVMPERTGPALAQTERRQRAQNEPADYTIDGTDRPRQRPKSPEKQVLHYSGKKKTHCDKNLVIVNTQSKRVAYLGPTQVGKVNDKKMADDEHITYPRRARLRKDTGFQGYEPSRVWTEQPKKSRAAKSCHVERNAAIARSRVFGFESSMLSAASNARAV